MVTNRSIITMAITLMAAAACGPLRAQEHDAVSGLSSQTPARAPAAIIFEKYVLDVIGQLPASQSDKIQSMNLHKVFNTKAQEWRAVVKEALHLSNTIDVAILDLWYTNQDLAAQRGVDYSALSFARDFVDQYQKDGSQVDVWQAGALEKARARIEARKKSSVSR